MKVKVHLKNDTGAARRKARVCFRRVRDVSKFEGYPVELKDRVFSVTVLRGSREDRIPAKASEPVAAALRRAGIRVRAASRAELLSGSVFVCPEGACRFDAVGEPVCLNAKSAWPTGDLKIRIPTA